jgi:hypothetical protein
MDSRVLELSRQNGVRTVTNAAPARPDLDPKIFELTDILCVNETEAEIITERSLKKHGSMSWSPFFGDFRQFSAIFSHFLAIFSDFRRFSAIFANFRRKNPLLSTICHDPSLSE